MRAGATLGRGNARWSSDLHTATVLRRLPQLLSSRGKDPISALRDLAQEAATPETLRILALRVDFLKDSPGDESTGDGRFDLRPADEAKIPIDPPPHNRLYFEGHLEALRRYYNVQTRGTLVLEYNVFPQEPDSAYHLSDTARYGPWFFSVSSDTIIARAVRIVQESLQLADSLDASIDWKRYQSFIVFHAGTDMQGDVNQDTPYDIPSFNLPLGDSLEVVVGGADSVRVNLVMVVPETVSQDEFTGALNGVLAHEFGHQLGFFDLYNVYTGLPVVGVFSLMDSGEGQFGVIADPYDTTQVVAVRGILPASLDPWQKLLFFPGSVRLHEGIDGEETALPAVLLDSDILYVPVHLAEYFLAENRLLDYNGDGNVILRADPETGVVLGPEPAEGAENDTLAAREYDYLLPGGGTLIWHIDELAAIVGLNSPYGSVNVFSDRPGVDVEEADGIQDIGTASPEFFGGPFDPYFVGGYTLFAPNTVPNSATNDGTETGVSLEVLDPVGLTMRVRMGVPHSLSGWPVGFQAATVAGGLNRADLNGDGVDEILLAAGFEIYAVSAEGTGYADDGERSVFAIFPDTLDEGPTVVDDWAGSPLPGPTVLVHSGGQAWWFDRRGSLIGYWPLPDSLQGRRATAGPILDGEELIVGCNDGAVRGLHARDITADVLWTLTPFAPGGSDSVVALAAGHVGAGEPFRVAAGTAAGLVYLGASTGQQKAPAMLAGWPQSIQGAGPIRSLLLLRAPLRLAEDARDLVLIAGEGPVVDLKDSDGRSIDGWPKAIADTLAGSPAVGDLDGDGVLEVAATTRSGDVYLWDLSGASELQWPRSIWEADRTWRPAFATGPRFWDVGGDGKVELVQLRGDGILMVMDAGGRPPEGWPYASGAPGTDGPLRVTGPDGGERWYIADALSDSLTALSALLLHGPGAVVHENGRGCFPGPGVGPARTWVYPDSMVPTPLAADAFFDLGRVIFHPNPVREGGLKIHYVLGDAATMEAEAIDLSGRPRAKARWQGLPGAAGQTYVWDLSDLASGAYVVRLHVMGARESRTVTRMIGVVR